MDEEEVNKLNDLNKNIIEEVTSKISCDAVMEKVADLDTIMEEVTGKISCDYDEPHVEGIPIPVEGAYYDTIDEALDMYTKYAKMDGFEIKKGGQRLTKSGAVQHKYIYCNKEGVPKGTVQEPLAEGTEGALSWVQNDLESTLTCLLKKKIGHGMNPRGGGAAGYGGVQNRVRNVNSGQARPIKYYNCNGGQDNAFDDDVNEQPVQDLALNVDNVLQVDDYDAFDSDVDEAPTAQTMFMANLSSADPVTDEAGPSYDSDILSEVRDHDHYQDAVCAHHEEHAMHDSVQLNHVVDSHADYTSDSNMIPYDQYVKDNEVPDVHSDVSSIPNDAFMMIYNDMCEPHAQSVSNPSLNTVVKNSLTAKLATYKEQVELYERRAKSELTEREQKINEQLRLVIFDRNFKEETLKRNYIR
nr:FAR1 DNA binding domain-containing protein [Tanacetum cinerariifolium]